MKNATTNTPYDYASDDDLTARLRDWPTSDGIYHIADERGFCQTCSLRMPCDWAQILDDVNEAADRIDELEADNSKLRRYLMASDVDTP